MNTLLLDARSLAGNIHRDQEYGKCIPYICHLYLVEATLRRFGATEEKDLDLLVAAWLHDTVETKQEDAIERGVLLNIIHLDFGGSVRNLVYAVTDEPGKNRKERHAETYLKIKACPGATRLKLADRISNVENCILQKSNLFEMYKKEHDEFHKALYIDEENEDMWECLNDLIYKKEIEHPYKEYYNAI